jgi:hypothetical protein
MSDIIDPALSETDIPSAGAEAAAAAIAAAQVLPASIATSSTA